MSRMLPPFFQILFNKRYSATGRIEEQATTLSAAYRAHRPSSEVIRSEADAVAYALTRAPATFAAISRVLERLSGGLPDFAPQTMLDVGAGPGTASFAASGLFPSLKYHHLVDHNPEFVALSRQLLSGSDTPALRAAEVSLADPTLPGWTPPAADLTVLAYALTEISDARAGALISSLLKSTSGALVIVEPGTPRDFARLMAFRSRLVAEGGVILAPCPHQRACPLPADDWCHFSVRLPRTREHRQLKGASAPFEDEKFSYLIVVKDVSQLSLPRPARVLRPPQDDKPALGLSLCTEDGLADLTVPRRDKARHKQLAKLGWGDAVDSLD